MTAPAFLLALDVPALLARPLSELRGFADAAGRPVTPRQVRDALVEQLASGNELLPIGPRTPFDFTKK
jgi:hypothetical protein